MGNIVKFLACGVGAAAILAAMTITAEAQSFQAPASSAAERMEMSWDAYPFSLKYTDGRTLSSDDLSGKAVFIDAWATWCAPCMPSLPKFSKLYNANIGNPYVKVISVHLSDRYGRFDSAAEFLRSKQLYYPVLQDPDGDLVNNLDVVQSSFAVPHYVLMDGSGKVVRRYGEINDKVIMDVQNYFNRHTNTKIQQASL